MTLGQSRMRYRELLVAIGLLAAGMLLVGVLFVSEREAIISGAASGILRTLDDMNEDASSMFRQATDLISTVEDSALVGLERGEAMRTFMAIAQGPVQHTQLLNSLYIGFPNGEFWQHREVPATFLASQTMDGAIHKRGYRRTILEGNGGRRSIWYYFSGPRSDWVAVPEPNFDYDPRKRNWYELAAQSPSSVWTEPYRTASSSDYAITLARKLLGPDGKIWGVAAIDFLFAPLNSMLSRWKADRLPSSALLRVIDKAGNVIARPLDDQGAGGVAEKTLVDIARGGVPGSRQVPIDGRINLVASVELGRGMNVPLIAAVAVPLDSLTGKATGQLFTNTAILAAVLMVLGAIAFYAVRMRGVASDIGEMERLTRRIAEGELDIEIPGIGRQGPIGGLARSFEVLRQNSVKQRGMQKRERELASNLSATALRVAGSVEAIRTAAAEISQGSNDLALRTERQALALQHTVATMEDISATVSVNASNSDEARALAKDALSRAEVGGKAVSSVVEAMSEIENSSTRISKIIQVIEEIAFQTKLLAVNAAVEAARAGETGKGFAVVAQEVRSLADRSRQASMQIRQLIAESSQEVEQGVKLADAAGAAIGGIITTVRKVAEIAPEIAAGSHEQARAIADINKVLADLDADTQKNAALVEESSASAGSLAGQASQLVEAVAILSSGGTDLNREP